MLGTDLFGEPETGARHPSTLAQSFDYPPFSVLSARDGWWQERKREWLSLGIRSELGRESLCATVSRPDAPEYLVIPGRQEGGSVFDPVLAELCCKWWCPAGGSIVDPFAGGSVRGVVASLLGFRYSGCELRAEQVVANREQGHICGKFPPVWVCDDSRNIGGHFAPGFDFMFSCPPYADLEVYSDDPRDISTLDYESFLGAYREIITASAELLASDRFACFVVGNMRDKRGILRDFVGDTVAAFKAAGLCYYNEAMLVTAIGTLPVRVGTIFRGGRKLGKTHQNVLVFCKGDPKRAANACEHGI